MADRILTDEATGERFRAEPKTYGFLRGEILYKLVPITEQPTTYTRPCPDPIHKETGK